MDLDRFNAAVHAVRAQQFLREKTASAVGLSAIDAALQVRAEQTEDPDLFKIATQYCPEDALGLYVKLGGRLQTKTAEPGSPPGVSTKEWDKKLQEGPEKEAAVLGKLRRVTEGYMKDYARHGDKAMQLPRGQKMLELSSKLMRRGGAFSGGEEAYTASRGYQHKDKKLVELGERLFGGAEKTAGDVVKFTRPLASKAKDLVKKIFPAAKGTVRKVDFANPEGVRSGINKAREAASRAAHNAKTLRNAGLGKADSRSTALSNTAAAAPLAGVAALTGGLATHMHVKSTPKSVRDEQAAQSGPIGRALSKHPALGGAALTGTSVLLGLRAKSAPGAAAGLLAPMLVAGGADRVLKHLENKKKRTS